MNPRSNISGSDSESLEAVKADEEPVSEHEPPCGQKPMSGTPRLGPPDMMLNEGMDEHEMFFSVRKRKGV